MAGVNVAAIGETDSEAVGGRLLVGVRAVDREIVAGAAGVGDGRRDWWGWRGGNWRRKSDYRGIYYSSRFHATG